MTHRERVVKALRHQPTDRVPFDLGSTRVSSITVGAYEPLKQHFGITQENVLTDQMQQTVRVDEAILEALDIDTRIVLPGPPDQSSAAMLPDGRWRDEWGVLRRPQPQGYYWELDECPLAGEPSRAVLEDYPWPDPDDPGRYRGLAEEARHLRENTDYAVVGHAPGGWVHIAQYLRGFEGWYLDLASRPDFAVALMTRVRDLTQRMAEHFLQAVGPYLDVVAVGDDIATQLGPMVSPSMYRDLIKPLQQEQFDFLHAHTDAPVFYHTCGSIYALLPDLIEIGVDILNPVQVTAAEMGDTARLKREFGAHLCFWGGIDTQHVLPHGTPEDVRAEVQRRLADLAPGGGYVLNAVHNIQPDVSVENILAMYEAGREWEGPA